MKAIYDDAIPFNFLISLTKIIIVRVKVSLLLPWIGPSRPICTQFSYKIDFVQLELSDYYHEWKDHVDLFGLQMTIKLLMQKNHR